MGVDLEITWGMSHFGGYLEHDQLEASKSILSWYLIVFEFIIYLFISVSSYNSNPPTYPPKFFYPFKDIPQNVYYPPNLSTRISIGDTTFRSFEG